MEKDVILVTNLPPQTTGNELTIYFQSVKKSGGGDVENVQLTGGTVAAITFESEEVHDRVLQREHTLRGQRLTLSLLPERIAKELLKPCPADQATGYDRTTQESVITGPRTVRVTGLPAEITEDAVQNYFENTRKSKGGDTESVILKLGLSLAFVTFCSPSDARSTAEHKPHVLQGSILDVKLLENDETPTISGPNLEDSKTTHTQEPDEPTAPLAFVVSGVQPQSTDDTLTNYLENSRRSGGGSVKQILRGPKEGEATVLFEDVVDLDRLLQGPHRLDGAVLNIAEKEPQKEIPLDQRKLCVSGLSEKTTEDGLELYLERLSNNNRVEQINRGYGDNLLVQFREDISYVQEMKKNTLLISFPEASLMKVYMTDPWRT